ncbi:hypothetical protein [Streptomyces ureilyticus]|uniref:FXSXX-COOH protein n=1 Tax=Streptomyces ureilyticus TaxID=1775131 RepID=A0ABX0DLN5_9ACTN|nr:hypothetical protein [Streptomyces ureilyticus]NGO41630.1 hypothetical protein [Streptomyces ureilyticus]
MADTAEITGTLQSDLINLSGIPLDALGSMSLLPTALATLHRRLAGDSAPLCESGMAALCGTTPSVPTGATRDS